MQSVAREHSEQSIFHQDWGFLVLAAVVLGLIFFYPLVLPIPLLDPDEGLHASISQEMVEHGHWLVPQLIERPFWDKPILYFWAQAVSLRFWGMHEPAVRLPGMLFGLLGVWSTAVVARRLLHPKVGTLAALCYATTVLPASLVQAASHDVALVPWVNLAVVCLWEMDRSPRWRGRFAWAAGAGGILALALLTKGLVGVVVVGGAFGLYLLLSRRLRRWHWLAAFGVLLVAALLAAPWYLYMELRSPGYLYYWFVQRHLGGFLHARLWHGQQPWWYYLPVLLGGGLPWVIYLPAAAWGLRLAQQGKLHACSPQQRQGLVLLWCWFLGGLMFFCVSRAKLVTYVWPLFPPMAVLAAWAWFVCLRPEPPILIRHLVSRAFWTGCLIGPVALPAAMAVVEQKFGFSLPGTAYLVGGMVAASCWLVLLLWKKRGPEGALGGAYLVLACHLAFVMTVVIPPLSQQVSSQALAELFNRRGYLPSRLVFYRDRLGSFVFYLRPELRRQLSWDRIVLLNEDQTQQLKKAPVVITPCRFADQVSGVLGQSAKVEQAGRHVVFWVRRSDFPSDHPAVALPPSGPKR